jgi:hypothetical protein
MSFKRLEPEDFLLSTDSVVAGAFAGGSSTNTTTDSLNDGASADYYTAYGGTDGRAEVFVTEATKSADGDDIKKQVIYKQFANIIQGDSNANLDIGDEFTAYVIDRARYKQAIFPASFILNNKAPLTGSANVSYGNAGRVYESEDGTMYLYPDIGTALLSGTQPTFEDGLLTVQSEEVITSNYVFVRARNAEFNYSQNPTFIDSTTGGVRFTDFISAPQTFITTVGLYNDNGDLLAVAKLSKPLKKDFTKEALIRVKLDF